MTRVVVIGAGLLGSAVADELAGRGVDVTVLEAGTPGRGTSGASFAWVNAQEKAPASYFELNHDGVRAYPGLASELGGDWYHPGGDLAIGRGTGAAKVADKIERHRAVGYAVRELDRAGVADLEPQLSLPADGELTAAHFPDEAWIDAPALVERRIARARERGADVRTGPDAAVSGLDVEGGRVRAVRTAAGAVEADAVVVSAGTGSSLVAGLAGTALPMAPSPGLLVFTEPVTHGVSRVVHAGDVALRPDSGGRLLLSSREVDATLDAGTRELPTDDEAVRDVVSRAARILPSLAGVRVAEARIGIRSVAGDGMPVAGFAPGVENLYLLVAHSGASLAPVLGRLVAGELTGPEDDRLAAYRPARFAS